MTISRPLWVSQRGGTQLAVKLSFPTDADGNGVLTDDEVGTDIVARVGLPKVAKVGDVITVTDGTTPADITLTQTDLDAGYVESTFSWPAGNLFSGSAWITHTADPVPAEIGLMVAPAIDSGSYDETSGEIVLDLTDDSTGDPDYREVYRDTGPMDPQALPTPHATNLPASQAQFREAVAEDGTTYYYRTANVKGSKKKVSGEVSVFAGDPFDSVQIGDEIGGGIYAGSITYADSNEYHIISAKEDGEVDNLLWGFDGVDTGATDYDDGKANTDTLQSLGGSQQSDHCVSYSGGGKGDWYMPALNELSLVRQNLWDHPEFNQNSDVDSAGYTASSTEYSSNSAGVIQFSNGFTPDPGTAATAKDRSTNRVRPIRRVPV